MVEREWKLKRKSRYIQRKVHGTHRKHSTPVQRIYVYMYDIWIGIPWTLLWVKKETMRFVRTKKKEDAEIESSVCILCQDIKIFVVVGCLLCILHTHMIELLRECMCVHIYSCAYYVFVLMSICCVCMCLHITFVERARTECEVGVFIWRLHKT